MTVHVAGAGLAGLAAALTAARAGHGVVVHEAAGLAGGRCRSFFDPTLGRVIDNGTHVVLGANRAALGFLGRIGGADAMVPAASGNLPFLDLESGATWSVDVAGRGIRTLMKAAPGVKALTGLAMAGITGLMRPGATVAAAYGHLGALYERLIEPLSTAVMNCPPEEAPASLLARVIAILAGGGRGALAPLVARTNLAEAFVGPALGAIEALGGEVRFHDPLTAIETAGKAARAGIFRSGRAPLGPGDALILALPPWALAGLQPRGEEPPSYRARAIICAHFATEGAPEVRQAAR
ncbi:MAG: FAD-dependent oxidoreductase, partial [Alphaproteobacteria bacterium]|nr:FAD-dependent oxidoreductase [Alphaproteobacteria bacterium]